MKLKSLLLALLLVASVPHADGSVWLLGGSPVPTGGGGQTLVFNYASGFTGAHSAFSPLDSASFTDPTITLLPAIAGGGHFTGGVWYSTKLNITAFTTDFSFQIGANPGPNSFGLVFAIQNQGLGATGDANGMGYFAYSTNLTTVPIANSIGIVFDGTAGFGPTNRSFVGLYIDGGPYIDNGIATVQDLFPQSIDINSGDVMNCHLVYDGTTLSLTVTDATTGAKAYYAWVVDIPTIVGASTAYAGMAAGYQISTATAESMNSWVWYSGYNTRLSSPTFSPAAGQYTTSQTVSISGPSGATIYYTTNGKPPTTQSSVYSTPITVSANEFVQAIAVESNFSDSKPASANYLIQSSASPTINFPSTFASASGLFNLAGDANISGAALQITKGAQQVQNGSAFYVAPITVSTFTTNFTFNFAGGTSNPHQGMTFVIENPGLTSYNDVKTTFSPAPSAGATSGTLATSWGSAQTGVRKIQFSDGETRNATYTMNSSTVDWSSGGGALTNSVGATATFIANTNTGVGGGPYTIGQGNNGSSSNRSYGYQGIGNSIGVTFDAWNNTVGIAIKGAAPSSVAVTGITLGLHPDAITLTYNGTTLSLTIQDTVTLATFSPSAWPVNIPSDVGANTAYVGFTASTYDTTSATQVTDWTM